jgi:WhiB family redox-sensing transcriptional regulator
VSFNFGDYSSAEFMAVFSLSRPRYYSKALCLEMGIDLFFPELGQSNRSKKAKIICKECPVQLECLSYAMDNKIEDGVWGGSTPKQRIKWRQKKMSAEDIWETLKIE